MRRAQPPDPNLPRVLVGGGWELSYAPFMRPDNRGSYEPEWRETNMSFRTHLSVREPRV